MEYPQKGSRINKIVGFSLLFSGRKAKEPGNVRFGKPKYDTIVKYEVTWIHSDRK